MQVVLTDTQQVELVVTAKNKRGQAVAVQSPAWKSSDESIVSVAVDAGDPMKATAKAAGPAGAAMVTFEADGDLGDGVQPIVGTLDVVVTSGPATVIEIAAGSPTEQPSA
jgi:hypothetical protein